MVHLHEIKKIFIIASNYVKCLQGSDKTTRYELLTDAYKCEYVYVNIFKILISSILLT